LISLLNRPGFLGALFGRDSISGISSSSPVACLRRNAGISSRSIISSVSASWAARLAPGRSEGERSAITVDSVTHSKLDPKKTFAEKEVDFERIFDDSQSELVLNSDETSKAFEPTEPGYHEKLVDTTAIAAKLIRSLKLPLWCIFATLVLLLISL